MSCKFFSKQNVFYQILNFLTNIKYTFWSDCLNDAQPDNAENEEAQIVADKNPEEPQKNEEYTLDLQNMTEYQC